jgi:ubiquitin-like 1-activating enzyme E1 A
MDGVGGGGGRGLAALSRPLLLLQVVDQEEFAPACAVLGGVIANNVIKAISNTGAPVRNLVLYSVADGVGAVE